MYNVCDVRACQMCAGAIIQSRLTRVVVGCMNPKAGCAGSVLNLLEWMDFNHKVEVIRGVLQEECSIMLSDFSRASGKEENAEKIFGRAGWKIRKLVV